EGGEQEAKRHLEQPPEGVELAVDDLAEERRPCRGRGFVCRPWLAALEPVARDEGHAAAEAATDVTDAELDQAELPRPRGSRGPAVGEAEAVPRRQESGHRIARHRDQRRQK